MAAEDTIPTAPFVRLNDQRLHSLVMLLMDILLYLDDLNPSTSRYSCHNKYYVFLISKFPLVLVC